MIIEDNYGIILNIELELFVLIRTVLVRPFSCEPTTKVFMK